MISRGQIFVRAVLPTGRWDNVDVLDLDDDSFRAFIIDVLHRNGFLAGLLPEHAEGDEIELQADKDRLYRRRMF